MFGIAYAQEAGAAAGGAQGFLNTPIGPLLVMFVIFYFLLIRPQQKKAKEHSATIQGLKKGDKIITGGGIHGRITADNETILTVEIANNVQIKVSRHSVAGLAQPSVAENKQPKKGKSGSGKLKTKK